MSHVAYCLLIAELICDYEDPRRMSDDSLQKADNLMKECWENADRACTIEELVDRILHGKYARSRSSMLQKMSAKAQRDCFNWEGYIAVRKEVERRREREEQRTLVSLFIFVFKS